MYYIGIDGGGTKTTCILTDEQLNTIALSFGGAANPLKVGFKNSAQIISDLIENVCTDAHLNNNISLCAGIAGCGNRNRAVKLGRLILNQCAKNKLLLKHSHFTSDAEIALEGALNGKKGALLILGTGSILCYKIRSNEIEFIGGYGKLIGDEGSGYSIGRKGLQAAGKYYDNRSSKTILVQYLSQDFGIINRDTLIKEVYSENLDIAGIARLVINAASKKDRICMKILEDEIKEIIQHLNSLLKKVKIDNFQLSFAGNLAINKNYFSAKLKREINSRFPHIKIIKPKYPPEMGAVLLAKKLYKNDHSA